MEISTIGPVNPNSGLDQRSDLEARAQHLVGPNKLTMLFANPNSELFLALLARVVTLLISANAYTPNTTVKKPVDVDASTLSPEELLKLRKEKI